MHKTCAISEIDVLHVPTLDVWNEEVDVLAKESSSYELRPLPRHRPHLPPTCEE